MLKVDYSPLFAYLQSHKISANSIINDSVVAEGVFTRMRRHQNIETDTICRLMDYLGIEDFSLIFKPIILKDDHYVIVRDR